MTKEDLNKGEVYTHEHWIIQYKGVNTVGELLSYGSLHKSTNQIYNIEGLDHDRWGSIDNFLKDAKVASPEDKEWFTECKRLKKYLPKESIEFNKLEMCELY